MVATRVMPVADAWGALSRQALGCHLKRPIAGRQRCIKVQILYSRLQRVELIFLHGAQSVSLLGKYRQGIHVSGLQQGAQALQGLPQRDWIGA